jgi:uncharacterized protein
MKIFLSGGTGFLGKFLSKALVQRGHKITLLARPGSDPGPADPAINVLWGDPCVKGDWQARCPGHEAVINLTGASIFQRWTKNVKREILDSRLQSTENIVEAMTKGDERDMVLLNASGVGYYGHCNDVLVDETSPPGNTFLASVARSWEERALRAKERGVRVIICRLGIVLGPQGGAFRRMLPLVKYHLGAPWGRGGQWFSWIHERDVAEIFCFLLTCHTVKGPVNVSSPNPVTNSEMMSVLNRVLGKKPYMTRIPSWALICALGEFSEVFLEGQRVIPEVLQRNGFRFQCPGFRESVADLARPQETSDVRRR